MTDLNDPSGIRLRLKRQLNRLDDAPIATEDKEKVRDFLAHLQANKDNTVGTNANHVKLLRLTAERADVQLTEMSLTKVNSLTVELQHDYGLAKSTLNNYKGAWKPFYRFLGRDWSKEIGFFVIDSEVDKDKIYTDEEIDAMIEAAGTRTTPAIAVLADTGMRVGMLVSIPVAGVDFEGDVPILQLNPDAPTKGAEGNIPLTFSRAYVTNYLQGGHPRPNQDDVALIHLKRRYDDDDGAVQPKVIRRDIYEVMEEAGIPEERRRLHNFRHTAVTRWLRMNIPDQILEHRTKWSDMSVRDNYAHLVDDDLDEMTGEFFGLVDKSETDGNSSPEDVIGDCPVCTTTVRHGARYCPGCGNPIEVRAAHDVPPEGVQEPEETAEDLADMDGVLDEMSTAAIIERLLQRDPDLLDEIDFAD